ncbi:MAG: protein-export chaperone SecB [Pseudomonadota bacterium]
MADAENGAKENGAASATQPQIKMQIVGQYIRDLSFENNVVQQGISGEVNPDIQVQVSIDAKKRQVEHQFEVVSKFIITSKNKGTDQTLFLMELDYGGIFLIENVPEEQMHPFLFIECPRMLFPYARRIVSDVTRDGGFPQLNLENIDFVALYRQTLLQRQAAQKAAAENAEKDEPAN